MTSGVFDVAIERERAHAAREKVWTRKRKEIDGELRTALDAALREPDAAQSATKLCAVESLIAKRKLATSMAQRASLRAAAQQTFGTDGREFSIIYADPPWQYESTSNRCGTANHYDTMTLGELAALPVAGLAAADSVLVMWATYHMLEQACSLFASWGFELRTIFVVWVKVDRAGNPMYRTGKYTLPCSEFALLGMRGTMQIRQRSQVVRSIFRARPTGHSRKPPEVRNEIVRLFGDLPRIELFARASAPDWHVWGNQTTRFSNDYTGDDDDDGDEAAPEAGSFLPRVLNRAKKIADRVYRIDSAGAVKTFAPVTVGTSFSRLEYQFDALEPTPATVVDDDHDHDGTRRCCLPLSDIIPIEHIKHMTRLSAELSHRGGYAPLRDSLYTSLSQEEIRTRADDIKQQQLHNADVLFAINNNKHHLPARVAAPAGDTT